MRRLSVRVSSVFGILLFLCCGGGGEQPQKSVQKEDLAAISKSILMVIAPKDFRDEEFKVPYDLFRGSGFKVVVASTDTAPAKGMLGMTVKPDITLERVDTDNFDGVVVVGGSGCQVLWDNATLHEIVRGFNAQKKMIAAICIAPVVLARAGILVDKTITVYPAVRDEVGKYCARSTDADVEISGNVITCSGPKAAANFARSIITVMNQ